MHAKVHREGSCSSPIFVESGSGFASYTLLHASCGYKHGPPHPASPLGILGSNLGHHSEFCLQSHLLVIEFLLSVLRLCLLQWWFSIETLPIGLFASVWRCLWLSQMEVGCLLSRDQGCGWTSYSPQGNHRRKSVPASDVNSLQHTLNTTEKAHWRSSMGENDPPKTQNNKQT